MKLIKVQVTNYRSAEDTGEFELDHTTCLVGKNEAGKTAVLQALASLNPHPATPVTLEKERDYPKRYLTRYDERHPEKEAIAVTTKWGIDDEEADAIVKAFGEKSLKNREVTILRRYESDSLEWKLPIDFHAATQHLIEMAHLSAPEKAQLKDPKNSQELRAAVTAIEAPTVKHNSLISTLDNYPRKTVTGKVQNILEVRFPYFMYFSNYDRMSGQVRLETLQANASSNILFTDNNMKDDRLFFEFLEYANAPLDDILTAGTYESFNSKLQAASNAITDEILDYWTQNPDIEVRISVDAARPNDQAPFNEGTIGRARIYNQLHRVEVPFSERSAGFIWFFSFLIKFAQVKKGEDRPIFLLLDEPGLSLHGKAQADLLRYFEEKLAPDHQIIYSSHSPFMVQPDRLTSARIVEDKVRVNKRGRREPVGTKVRADILNSDPDTIFPLQGALGYEITQTLFIGKHTLLVEGPSDILFLKALSAALARRNRPCLAPEWTLCPAGGIGNIRPFVSLFKGNDLNIVVFSDYAKRDRQKIENLRASEILREGAVLTVEQFVEKPEADAEDLFDPNVYVLIVNAAYGLSAKNALTVELLEDADKNTCRTVKKAEAYFRLLPEEVFDFDHYRPAEYLIENPSILDGDDPSILSTLNRAEKLFDAINKFLVDSDVK